MRNALETEQLWIALKQILKPVHHCWLSQTTVSQWWAREEGPWPETGISSGVDRSVWSCDERVTSSQKSINVASSAFELVLLSRDISGNILVTSLWQHACHRTTPNLLSGIFRSGSRHYRRMYTRYFVVIHWCVRSRYLTPQSIRKTPFWSNFIGTFPGWPLSLEKHPVAAMHLPLRGRKDG